MFSIIFLCVISATIILCNLIVAFTMDRKEMEEEFIEENNFLGKILANTFYALAWGY